MQATSKHSGIGAVLWLGLCALVVIGGLNYQALLDEYALATYTPSANELGFEARVGLSRLARAQLYRSKPQYDAKTTFNTDCDTRPHELELGCFYRGRIYILQIDNPSLAPEMDVVVAHELLHAAWVHESSGERATLSAELERVYGLVASDDLRTRMAGYAKSEPGEETNELHSILGTEFAILSPLLEAHYGKYFPDRTQLVKAHAAYQAVFDTRKVELETELAAIRSKKGTLSVMNRQLEVYRTKGQISSYNALVPRQNQLVDEINAQIANYRTGVDEYNALSKSLDSGEITDTETPAQ
jgi:hypothetical protein